MCFDADTGQPVWSHRYAWPYESASYCSVLPITPGGHRLVVAFMRNALMIFDPATGRLCRHDKLSHDYDEHAAAPMSEEPYLVVASAFRRGAECYRWNWNPATRQSSKAVRHGSTRSFPTTSPHRSCTRATFTGSTCATSRPPYMKSSG